jgi:heptosyltransferase II
LEPKIRNSKSGTRTLVVGPSWVGDMVLAQSLFRVLKQRQPQSRVDVLAPPWTLPVLARMPEVDEAIPLPFNHGEFALRTRLALGRSLRERGYDRAILLPNSLKSAIVPFAACIRVRTGFVGEMRYGLLNDTRKLDKKRLPRTVDRFVALALEPGEIPPPVANPELVADAANATQSLARLGREAPTSSVLGLCPGAEYGPAKRWPAEHYAEVAQAKLAEGWEVWLFGSEKDVPVTGEIQRLTGNRCLDLGGRTPLSDAIDLMSLTTAVVSNDSGLMHVAAALGRKVAAIYGSSDPGHTPPMSPHATVLYLKLECSPCFERECPLGHLRCLRNISPASVLEALANASNQIQDTSCKIQG